MPDENDEPAFLLLSFFIDIDCFFFLLFSGTLDRRGTAKSGGADGVLANGRGGPPGRGPPIGPCGPDDHGCGIPGGGSGSGCGGWVPGWMKTKLKTDQLTALSSLQFQGKFITEAFDEGRFPLEGIHNENLGGSRRNESSPKQSEEARHMAFLKDCGLDPAQVCRWLGVFSKSR